MRSYCLHLWAFSIGCLGTVQASLLHAKEAS